QLRLRRVASARNLSRVPRICLNALAGIDRRKVNNHAASKGSHASNLLHVGLAPYPLSRECVYKTYQEGYLQVTLGRLRLSKTRVVTRCFSKGRAARANPRVLPGTGS